MADFDAVVVGAGPNGLAAALRLAEAGWSVCVLEANDEIGGTARTLESTLPGFKHDFGAGFLPLTTAAPAFTDRDLGRFGLRFAHAPLASAHPFPGGAALAMGASTAETAAWFAKLHHADADAWVDLQERWGDAVAGLMQLMLHRLPLREAAGLALRLGPARALEFAQMAVASAETISEEMFATEEARAFLTAWAMHADLPPEAPVSGIYALLMAVFGQRGGMPVAVGGTGAVSSAFGSALIAAGGVVATGRPVDRFVVEHGRVVGVETGGMPITAGRAVIATIDPADVLARTGEEHFPAGAVEQVRRFRHGLGALKVDWALDGPVPWIADPCREAAVVHVGDTVTDMSRAVWEAAHGLLPARPTLVLGQQSLADPTRAPAGQHTLWGYARVPPRPRGDAAHDDLRAGEEFPWDRVADRFATRMEALIEEYAPGFRDRILARRVWTPGALHAADATLVDGDISGGSFAIDQQLLFRPGPRWWRWGSPLKGLYLAGASVPPGGGVHGGGGDQAARQALADFRRPGMLMLAGAGAAAATTAALRLRARGRAAEQVRR